MHTSISRAKIVAPIVGFVTLLSPLAASAAPFGGMITQLVPCYNEAIYVNLSGPVGGAYIWTPSTKTYPFGPPRHPGQWLLGLKAASYYCIVSIMPVIVWEGTGIMMMGSSQ